MRSTYFLIYELRARSHPVSVSEMRVLQNVLFFTGQNSGVVAESIRTPRGVNSQLPIFDRHKWRSRCGVNSENCLRMLGAPGFDLFFTGRKRGVNSEPARSQFGASSQMLTNVHFLQVHLAGPLVSTIGKSPKQFKSRWLHFFALALLSLTMG